MEKFGSGWMMPIMLSEKTKAIFRKNSCVGYHNLNWTYTRENAKNFAVTLPHMHDIT